MRYILIIIFLSTLSCANDKIRNNHGTLSLEKKYNKVEIKRTNTNEILNIFGPPSTKSTFDNNIWIYIERRKKNRSIFKLGNQKIEHNNIVVIEIDKRGLVIKKDFLNINDMKEYKFTEKITETNYKKNSYIYGVIKSLKQKIDAPVKRKKSK
jgi:outer membrane protein assembly factor BamE (lipoprotein component of BamABCDE complex)|tara:strand:+ start:976 stop:1434 length:459 start_codon:yes stop_codon:yes gene_type:complete